MCSYISYVVKKNSYNAPNCFKNFSELAFTLAAGFMLIATVGACNVLILLILV